ncbi:DUF6292 family protein [Nonomuraea rhodomycinica]|uniref:DUF6292 domain-containing protein n=1 Tax=Nonomuraea rhodomycinica TaxID=1712872 RepID=A0A7Y6IJW2_9ACTN|nr:DUF6292 family protein [Nonomuraea rhodomycinica]NUW39055.1 hypothetical protein [Nonomuraea rhodomycinica]
MRSEHRADPRGYVQAVAAQLAETGLGNGGAVAVERPGPPRRVLVIRLDSDFHWEAASLADADALRLEWDEERGWALHEVHTVGHLHSTAYTYYALGLGLVPEPAEVAHVVRQFLADELILGTGQGPRLRRSADDDADLERLLATYPPAG